MATPSGRIDLHETPQYSQATFTPDGDDVALGAKADAEAPTGDASVIGLLKRLRTLQTNGLGQKSQAGAAAHSHEPAVNTAAVVTLGAAGAGVSNVVGVVGWSYDDVPTGGSLTIQDGAATIWKHDITHEGPGFIPFTPPMKGAANTAMVFTLTAGGAAVSGIVNAHAWTE